MVSDSENPVLGNSQEPTSPQPQPQSQTQVPLTSFSQGDGSQKPQENVKMPFFKKYKLQILIGLAVVLLLSVIVDLLFRRQNAQVQPETSEEEKVSENTFSFKAKIQYLKGTAWKIVDGRRVELKENDVLSQGDEIKTDPGTWMILAFDDGSVVRLDEGTSLTLDTLKPTEMSLKENLGKIFVRVQKDEEHLFSILAGDLKVTSQGTAFYVEKGDTVEVGVYESSVKVEKEGKTTDIAEGSKWSTQDEKLAKINNKETSKDEFISWNLSEDKLALISTTPSLEPTSKPDVGGSGISLSGVTSHEGIKLKWSVNGVDTSNGFKVIKSLEANPTYPENSAVYLQAGVESYIFGLNDGKTWHFRVCQFRDGSCGVYSNEVVLTAASGGSGDVSKITLKVEASGTSAKLSWSVEGYATSGFKVAWSKNSGPTYPPRDGDFWEYLSEPGTREYLISHDIEEGSTYYFRVCEYKDGKCGTYSNEVSL